MVFFCPTCSEDFEDSRSLQGHNRPECDRCYACFPKGEFVGHKCKVPSWTVRDHKADSNLPDAFRESTSYACFAAARNAALAAVGL
ncbi:hypothetical protein CISIN_1g034736mg [Citrus sinensis]|uniref:Uncharacterized protein n=1 Tax=Citrus sinensis TaxID=2711 RepID=A0A067EHK3_CITSI|nr:hypothetical protein CISIN_1g034736mg [Citrus sinensis]